jgi:hypothetical protein
MLIAGINTGIINPAKDCKVAFAVCSTSAATNIHFQLQDYETLPRHNTEEEEYHQITQPLSISIYQALTIHDTVHNFCKQNPQTTHEHVRVQGKTLLQFKTRMYFKIKKIYLALFP